MKFNNQTGEQSHPWRDSRILDVHKASDYKEINDAVETVYQAFAQAHPSLDRKSRKTYRATLKALILDLYVGFLEGVYIAYSRNNNEFKNERLKKLHISGRCVVKIIDFLVQAGYAETHIGFQNRTTKFSRRSRVTMTHTLLELINLPQLPIPIISSTQDLIILKNSEKKVIDFRETQQTRLMRENICKINDFLATNEISLELTKQELAQLAKRLRRRNTARLILVGTGFRRVFNNSSFSQGGRFYGHWSQSIPREYRKKIRINHEETSELDFSGLHIRMLYHIAKTIPPEGDMYKIDGIDSTDRSLSKKILQAMINAPSRGKALMGARESARNEGKWHPLSHIKEIADKLAIHHSEIAKYFGTGYGVHLQHLDSQIAERVMLTLADKGIPALTIHDSFIVPCSHKDALEAAMIDSYTSLFGHPPAIDTK